MMETILSIFSQFWSSIASFLPGSPFAAFLDAIDTIPYLENLNWFFPVSECIIILEAWLAAIAIFYIYRAIMSFLHLIG